MERIQAQCFIRKPSFIQIHPTSIPVLNDYQAKLTLMSESLRNDGRVWVPKTKGDKRNPNDIPEDERDYYLRDRYPSYGNLSTRRSFTPKSVVMQAMEVERVRLIGLFRFP